MIINCSCCNQPMEEGEGFYGPNPHKYSFCSITCACMSGRFSVRKGWINADKPIKRHPPKQIFNMTDETYEKWIADLGWILIDGKYQLKETNSHAN